LAFIFSFVFFAYFLFWLATIS